MADTGHHDKVKDSIIHHTGSIRRIVEESDTTRKLFHDKLVESGFALDQIQNKEKNYEYDDMIKQVLDSLEICKEDQNQLEECCQAFLISLLALGEHRQEAIQLSRELREEWSKSSAVLLSKETLKKEEWKILKALDVKPMEQKLSRSWQPPLLKQHNPHNKFACAFDRNSNKIVEILFKNSTIIMPFADQLCDVRIISPCLRDQVSRIKNKMIQAKAIVSELHKMLSRGVIPAILLRKMVVVFKLHGNYFRDIANSLEKVIPINYKNFVLARRSEQVPDINCKDQASATTMAEKVQLHIKHQDVCTTDALKKTLYAQYTNMESRSGLLINSKDTRKFFELAINRKSVKAKQSNVPLDLHCLVQRKDSYSSRTLIFGDPGIGKSCIVTELCKGWYKGTHLQDYEYVILLRADNPRVRDATSIDDFVPEGNKKWLDPIKEVNGENSLFIIDGYDEFSEESRKSSSFYSRFICGDDDLALASIIVTARPWCTKQIKDYFQNEVEILGFTHQSRNEFIRYHLKEDANEFILQKPTETCPLTIPFLLTTFIEIFKEAKLQQQKGNECHFPKTQTKIYGSLIRTLVLRYARKDANLSKFIFNHRAEIPPAEFACFPRNIYLPFFEICILAYQLLICPTYSRSKCLPETFDLLIEAATSGSRFCYKFLHSTIQEYLAAYCISRMENRERKQCIQVLKSNIRYSLVLEFLYGFGCYDEPKNETEFDYYSTVHNFAVFRQLCEVEATHQDAMPVKSVYQRLTKLCVVKRTWPKPSPRDFWCLGRVIALSGCDWELRFTLRPITNDHLQMLHEGIESVGSDLDTDKYGRIKKLGLSLTEIDETKLQQCDFFMNDRCSSHIEELYLFENNFTSIIIPTLCHSFKNLKSLKIFLFHYNNVSSDDHESLINALANNCANLEHISLSNLHPHECELLVHNLKRLKIVEVWGISTASCETLFRLLPETSIEQLEIYQSEVTYDSLSSLPTTLHTSRLETLKLENCCVNYLCVEIIASAVPLSSSLKLLDLSNNLIENSGAELLLNSDLISSRVHFGDTWKLNPILSKEIRSKIENRS